MDTSKIQEAYPIGTCLDTLHQSLSSLEQRHGSLDSANANDLQLATLQLASLLLGHQASSVLPSASGTAELRADILRLITAVSSEFDLVRVKPLLAAVLRRASDQELWDQVYKLVTQPPQLTARSTPQSTPRPSPPLASQTPRTRSTGRIYNSSQHRVSTDELLKEELGVLYVDVPGFHDAFLGHLPGLEAATDAIFEDCQQRATPYYRDGKWVGWPEDANQHKVLEWLASFCDTLAGMARGYGLPTARRLLSLPDKYLGSSTLARRKLDVALVDCVGTRPSFSEVHVLGELKCNPKADTAAPAWFDMCNARYVREVFASQDDRRFVLAFTLWGAHMRVWSFDRIGGLSSDHFDINKNGRRLVSTFLGFLTAGRADLGYDPTIKTADDGKRFIEINRNGKQERLNFDHPPIFRIPCIAGRATTCWKAYSEDNPEKTLVIKDSWQHPERHDEGDLLRSAFMAGVTNVAEYYHHETVQVGGRDDDILHSVRKHLDVSHSRQARPTRSSLDTNLSRKRGSSPNGTMPTSKRVSKPETSCSLRPTMGSTSVAEAINNRVHRRVILKNYGVPIYKASSRAVLLSALEGCIRGHKSLLAAHLLHRDISITNLMIDEGDPARSFLIDLDLAVDLRRSSTSGSRGVIGTLAFMASGALMGSAHTFKHDLESFFWVLFWICIHYDGTGNSIIVPEFEAWNYMLPMTLGVQKQGYIAPHIFLRTISQHFTPSYQCLIPWVDQLRARLFAETNEEQELHDDMIDILRKAREDPKVAAPW